MPVFSKEGKTVLYVHVPKTGGTSVELFFEQNGFHIDYLDRSGGHLSLNRVRLCSPQHMHAATLARLFDLPKFDYAFMTVRNPFGRIASEYRFLRQQKLAGPDFNIWVENTLRAYQVNPYVLDNHIRPQIEFVTTGCRVFKQEDLRCAAWIEDVSTALGIPLQPELLEMSMVSAKEPEQVELDTSRRQLVVEFYRRDFAAFGYVCPEL